MNRADQMDHEARDTHDTHKTPALAELPSDAGRALERAIEWLANRAAAAAVSAQTGQSMVEYAVVVALIAVVSMGAIQLLGGGITTVFQNILVKIQGLGR